MANVLSFEVWNDLCSTRPTFILFLGKLLKDREEYILRIPDQNGISQLYNMLEIHHSGPEPSIL